MFDSLVLILSFTHKIIIMLVNIPQDVFFNILANSKFWNLNPILADAHKASHTSCMSHSSSFFAKHSTDVGTHVTDGYSHETFSLILNF